MKRALSQCNDGDADVQVVTEEQDAKRARLTVEQEKTTKTERGLLLKRSDVIEEVDVEHPHETLSVHDMADVVVYRRSDDLVAYVRDQGDADKAARDRRLASRVNVFAMLVLNKYFPGVVDAPLPIDGPVLLLGRDGGSLTGEQLMDIHRTGAQTWPDPFAEPKPMAWELSIEKAASLKDIYREPRMELMPKDTPWIFAGHDDRSGDHKELCISLFVPASDAKAQAVFRAYWMAAKVPEHFGIVIEWIDPATTADDAFGVDELDIVKNLLGSADLKERSTYGKLDFKGVTADFADTPQKLLYYDNTVCV